MPKVVFSHPENTAHYESCSDMSEIAQTAGRIFSELYRHQIQQTTLEGQWSYAPEVWCKNAGLDEWLIVQDLDSLIAAAIEDAAMYPGQADGGEAFAKSLERHAARVRDLIRLGTIRA
jgi:hypothetical protein